MVSSKISGQGTKVNWGYGIRWSGAGISGRSKPAKPASAHSNQPAKTANNPENFQRTYDRHKDLYESGALSKSDFENADANLSMAEANVEAEQVNIAEINNGLLYIYGLYPS